MYGKRWHIEFNTVLKGLCTVDIFQKSYTGSVEILEKYATEPLECSMGETSDDPFKPLKASSIVLKLIASKRLQFIEMFSADVKKHYAEVNYDGVLDGKYWFVTDLYAEPYKQPPFPVNLTAVDGIGLLKKMTFDLRENATIKGSLLHIFDKLAFDLPFDVVCEINEVSNGTVAYLDTLKQYAYLDDEDDDTMCSDVLEQLLLSMQSRIYQSKGKWIIEQIPELDKAHTVTHYTSAFVLSSSETIDNSLATAAQRESNFCKLLVEGAELTALPAWKQFELAQNYYLKENTIEGGTITESLFSDQLPNDDYISLPVWVYNETTDTYVKENRLIYDGGPCLLNGWECESPVHREIVDGVLFWTLETLENQELYVISNETTHLNYSENGRFTLKIEYCPGRKFWQEDNGVFFRGNARFEVKIQVQLVDLYLSDDGWTTEESFIITEVGSETFGTVFDLTVNSYSVPRSGNLKIKIWSTIYIAYVEHLVMGGVRLYVKNVSLKFYDETGDSLSDTESNTVVIDTTNSLIPSSYELDFVDIPDTVNALNIYNGGMILPSGLHTKLWYYAGKYDRLANLMILQYIAGYSVPRFKISCDMYSDIMHFGSILTDVGSGDRQFLMSKGTYLARSSKWSGCEWLELPSYPIQGELEAMFIGSVSDSVLNIYGPNAIDDGEYIIFPELTKDVFDITNTTYWHADFQSLEGFDAGQPRRWKKTWLSGPEIIEYALPDVQKYFFFKDIEDSELQTSMPIMVYSTDQTTNQETIEEFLSGYFWLYDGADLLEDNGTVLIENI